MKTIGIGLLVISISSAALTAHGEVWQSRVSAGVEYQISTGDTDDRPGLFAAYELELADPMSVMLGLDYFWGDYDVGHASGSFSSLGLEVLFVARHAWGMWEPYIGAGAGHYFNDFDVIDYPDTLGMLFMGGTRVQLGESITADFGLRHLSLRPDHIKREFGEVDMGAVIVRAGVVLAF